MEQVWRSMKKKLVPWISGTGHRALARAARLPPSPCWPQRLHCQGRPRRSSSCWPRILTCEPIPATKHSVPVKGTQSERRLTDAAQVWHLRHQLAGQRLGSGPSAMRRSWTPGGLAAGWRSSWRIRCGGPSALRFWGLKKRGPFRRRIRPCPSLEPAAHAALCKSAIISWYRWSNSTL